MTIKAILDTNVIISGIFWKGAPFEILKAWQPANHRALFIARGHRFDPGHVHQLNSRIRESESKALENRCVITNGDANQGMIEGRIRP